MCVHSPKTLLPSFGPPLPSDRLVPPSWFRTTSTVYSAPRARVYCTSKPDRVRCVSRICLHLWSTEANDRWVAISLSRNAVHTLRRIPLASSRAASLRSLPSCCSVVSRPFRVPKRSTRPTLRANRPCSTNASLTAEAIRAHLSCRPYAHPHWLLLPPRRLGQARCTACLLPRRGISREFPRTLPRFLPRHECRRSSCTPSLWPKPPVGSQGTVRACPRGNRNLLN